MIFVDTGAWFATVVPTDPNHKSAAAFLTLNREPLVTSNYVIDETLTLLRVRGERERALTLGARFFTGEIAEVYYLNTEDVKQAWKVFRDFADKDWSFTDCASRIVMEKLGIATAFAFDRHFRQFGTVAIVP
ncbi:MAG: PIN domain-containing protein [Acidobacteria bacterium]|nr:PIN domain-containing protein [Acidobacteriota bacterium]